MPTETYTATGRGLSDNSAGDVAWANPSNIEADDASATTAALTSAQTSEYLNCDTFGFSTIGDTDVVTGIQVRIQKREAAGAGSIRDLSLEILVGGVRTGNDLGDTGTDWPTSEAAVVHGGVAEDWGLSITGADVKAVGFGCSLRVQEVTGGNRTAGPDFLEMQITYEAAGAGVLDLVMAPYRPS